MQNIHVEVFCLEIPELIQKININKQLKLS
jgi:hypothetical protein